MEMHDEGGYSNHPLIVYLPAKIVRELHPDLFVTITSYDDMVQFKGYSYAHEHFENCKPKEKPGK